MIRDAVSGSVGLLTPIFALPSLPCMIEREVTIRNRAGLHTRPASKLVKTASQFDAEIFLRRDNYEINGKSVIGVMTLAAEQGATLTLVVDGEDEDAAAAAITELFEDGFGEEM